MKKESIIFTGDIAFSGKFENTYDCIVDNEIKSFMNSADNVIANIECPITDREINSDRNLNHKMGTKVLSTLKEMYINCFNLGNNHIFDCSIEGLKDTLKVSNANSIKTIGVGLNKEEASRTLIIGKDIRIGIISLIKEWNFLKADVNKPGCIFFTDFETIREQISYLRKQKVNYIVAIIHCGEEFSSLPMDFNREKYIKILDLGVDIIVGHHPHVVQNYEKIGDKVIFYSLGNFIFDTDYQRLQKHTENGVLVKINFTKDGFDFDYLCIKNDRTNRKIITADNIPIFTNIDEESYCKLYPLALLYFLKNKKIVENYHCNIVLKSENSIIKKYIKVLKMKFGKYKSPKCMKMSWTAFKSFFLKYRYYTNKELIEYIKQEK